MDWTHVFLAGYIGAVLTAIAASLRKKGWIGRGGAIALALAGIVSWNIIDVHYLNRSAKQNTEQKIDAAIAGMPTYQVLKEQEPQKFQQIRAQVLAMLKAGQSEQQVIDAIQPQILAIQKSRIAFAPDEQVVAVMQARVAQIAAVQKYSDDACYRFLFPAVKGGINPTNILPQSILLQRIEADVAMMRSAYGPNRHIITSEERQIAQRNAQRLVQSMTPQYGQHLQILSDPRKGIGNEKIACEIYKALWSNVLSLPKSEAAGFIRMALAD